ncbi:MAG TPA: sulfite exporter TauE/SafE family protein [Candidatus Binatia bacterium]|nr:sulfite exporter TauE/SafE family protein [Candidatus Binatia bacterium]
MHATLAVVVGLAGGALGGLIGLGGGFVMVPLFVYIFHMSQHDAQGTSLAVLLPPVGVLSVLQYWRAGHVDVRVALLAAVGFLVGGWLGGTIAQAIGGSTLRRIFAVFLILAAIDLLRRS